MYIGHKERVAKLLIEKKSYEDEKKYTRHHIKRLLDDLESGNLCWILISSHLYPETKIELTYNFMDQFIQIRHRIRDVSTKELNLLKNLGLRTYNVNNDLYCMNVSLNSKTVTDIIYFIMEHIGEQEDAKKIKIVKSGEYS